MSQHLDNYLRKYRRRSEDNLKFEGCNLIVLTDDESNPEHEDNDNKSDYEEARITKPADLMTEKLIFDLAHALDEEGAEKSQMGIWTWKHKPFQITMTIV